MKPTVLVTATSHWFPTARLAMALAKAGCNVEAVCSSRHPLCITRAVHHVHRYTDLAPLRSMAAAIDASCPALIIPGDDLAAHHLHRLYQQEVRHGRKDGFVCTVIERSLGDPESFGVVSERAAFMQIAQQEGVRVPETTVLGNLNELRKWLSGNRFPVVLKADGTSGGDGVRTVHAIEEAERAFRALRNPPLLARAIKRALVDSDTTLLGPSLARQRSMVCGQRFVNGGEATSTVACWKGTVLASLHFEVINKRNSAGPATVIRLIDHPEMSQAVVRMVRRLNLSGIHGFDFMLECNSRDAYLIEINPRTTQVGHLTLGAGRDLPAALVSALTGMPLQPAFKVTDHEVISLFPQEWMRDPGSEFLRSSHHDVPWEERELIRACIRHAEKQSGKGQGKVGKEEPWPWIPAEALPRASSSGRAIATSKSGATIPGVDTSDLASLAETQGKPEYKFSAQAELKMDGQHKRVALGQFPVGLVVEDRQPFQECTLLDEESFRSMVAFERKRTSRSQKPVLLLLIDTDGRGKFEPEPNMLSDVLSALMRTCRDTDFIGWYKENSVVGVMFTEISMEERDTVVGAMMRRVSEILRNSLGPSAFDLIQITLHVFPEDWDEQVSEGNPALYPDLEDREKKQRFALAAKRTIDVLGSAAALLMLAPIFIVVAILVKLSSSGPVFFRQERLGRFGKPFTFLKFRSMYVNNDHKIHQEFMKRVISGDHEGEPHEGDQKVYKMTNDPRITTIGRFIRRTSLDELPQFINVLKGDMSLVGPRPPLAYECQEYEIWHRRRVLEVAPGITGLWQVKGRSRVRFDDMVRLDLQYVRTWSLWLDLQILVKTPIAVLLGGDAF